MKKILALVTLIVGCSAAPNDPPPPARFKEGNYVHIILNNRMGIILSVHYDNIYSVRYSNDLGELKDETLEEYELKPLSPLEE
jgi:hypothetical protein